MKELFEKLNRELVDAILDGKYTIKSCDKYTVEMSVDGFSFSLWIANGSGDFCCYKNHTNTVELVFTDRERVTLFDRFKAEWKNKEKEQLEAEIEAIQNKLNLINK